ncbi:MAG: M56 family metallopeptidase [Silicimonas sp.]|nr:M56 family metallopeptidase [Silicimonas sp.]
MIATEALLDAFLNANILICIAYLFWLGLRSMMPALGLKHAYSAQLRLLNTVFLMVVAAPLIAFGFSMLQRSGLTPGVSVNLSDAVVAYYLNGGFEMKASEFQGLMLARDTFLLNLTSGAGLIAQGVILAFLVGFVIGMVRLVCSMVCLYRIVRQSYGWRSFGRLRLRLSDKTLVPFSTRGLWHYYVVIPSDMLANPHELKVSLAHEFQHIRQGDLEWEILLEALKPFFFLNPAYHAWKHRVEDLRELTCDSQVLASGRIGLRAYCDTLLSVGEKTLRRDRAFVIAVPKVTLVTADRSTGRSGKPSFLERRITSVLDARRPARKLAFVLLAAPLMAAMVLTTIAIQRPGDWSHDRLMLSTVVNLERLDEINRTASFGRIRY